MPNENEIVDSRVEYCDENTWAVEDTENYFVGDVDPGLGAVGGIVFAPGVPQSPYYVAPPSGPPPTRPSSAPPYTEPPSAPPRVRLPKSPWPDWAEAPEN